MARTMVVDEMGMGEVYTFPWVALGEEPSVVYRMLAPGVAEVMETENALVEKINPYDGADRVKKFELRKFLLDLKDKELPRRHLTNPTFNVAGFDAGYTGEGVKTIVSGRGRAKIDCRLVPNQDPKKIRDCVQNHLRKHGFEDNIIV